MDATNTLKRWYTDSGSSFYGNEVTINLKKQSIIPKLQGNHSTYVHDNQTNDLKFIIQSAIFIFKPFGDSTNTVPLLI